MVLHRLDLDIDDDVHQADILAIANSYRQASDNDTCNVMNVMSSPTPERLESLKFYAVPASWFIKAWPILSARPGITSFHEIPQHWKDDLGIIKNMELVMNTDDFDDERNDDDNGSKKHAPIHTGSNTAFEQAKTNLHLLHRRMALSKDTARMKPGLQHSLHYFFLGPSVWQIFKTKFGYDGVEICRSTCKAPSSSMPNNEFEQGSIAIALLPGEGMHATSQEINPAASSAMNTEIETVGIPPTGRFPYEKIIPGLRPLHPMESAVESTVERTRSPNEVNVSCANDQEVIANKLDDDKVILLPASTTPINAFSNPLFMDDMDLDSKSDRDSTCAPGVYVAARKRLASGLSNLGNTCFMNSTLQCLANTEGIRRYFLSGDYLNDLNKDNPLGTGGELAISFAKLLGEMWGVSSQKPKILGNMDYSRNYSHSSHSSVVVPRGFKECVGKHAEQFMGYEQHDSQEFATYLLDALHEDTNRVTKKPYIEKPEQGEDEPDDVAAEKAWQLHLQREDSRVLSNFVGQVKSRLECCEEGCNRVSTTFDPFMYLSVPIPGSTNKQIKLTFVPLNPNRKGQLMKVTVSKTANITSLLKKVNEKLVELDFCKEPIPLEDLRVADVWNRSVFKWRELDDDIADISDSDHTVVYQLQPLKEIRELFTSKMQRSSSIMSWDSKCTHRVKLDLSTTVLLNRNDHWMDVFANEYTRFPTNTIRLLNPRICTTEERVEFHKTLENFLVECYEVLSREESSGMKRAREDSCDGYMSDGMEMDESNSVDASPPFQDLVDRSAASSAFCNVKTRRDFAVLEFCANKVRQLIFQSLREEQLQYADGLIVQVSIVKGILGHNESRVAPLVIRIPSFMTVFELRQLLANRLSRSLVVKYSADDLNSSADEMSSGEVSEEINETKTGEPSSEAEAALRRPRENATEKNPEQSEMLIMRRAELMYERGAPNRMSRFSYNMKCLGVVRRGESVPKLAMASDEAEQASLRMVGQNGAITVHWNESLAAKVFNDAEYENCEWLTGSSDSGDKPQLERITILDCIQKFCQKEQLEESEMWYCNKCKKHVKAWKQFHLHRTPPYLIIHLKRFFFASPRRRDKISDFIDFPLDGLDLTDLVADYDKESEPIYDCYAVSNHIGGLGGGHYTAYILSDDGSWSYYNDSSVTTNFGKSDVVSPEAYVLYYRRKDVPIGQDREYSFFDSSRQASPMICENVASPIDQRSDVSSNNSAQVGDADATFDDIATQSSSGAATSPMDSVEHSVEHVPAQVHDVFGEDEMLYDGDNHSNDNFAPQ